MNSRNKKILWIGAAGLVLVALCVTFWIRRFHRYTPAEALQDLRAAAAVGNTPRPVERFLELRYGPLTEAANRQKAFLDFFNVGHIEGLYILVGRMEPRGKEANIAAMAQWVADYRASMSPEEKAVLKSYLQSETGQATIREATAHYLKQDVHYRAATAGVIAELLKTLTAIQKQ